MGNTNPPTITKDNASLVDGLLFLQFLCKLFHVGDAHTDDFRKHLIHADAADARIRT